MRTNDDQERPKMNKKSNRQSLRHIIQLLFLLFSLAFLAGIIFFSLPYTIHTICPYAIVCFGLSKNILIQYLGNPFAITIAFSFLILVLTIFGSRLFCAYICPLGTLQEIICTLFGKKRKDRKQIPQFQERRFASVKYIVLVVTIILSLIGINYIFIHFCPVYALSLLPDIAVWGLIVTLLIIVAGIFLERFWCRFLCPYAALMNLFQHLGQLVHFPRLKIHRNLERCNDCELCSLSCPMNINITENESVQNPNCILCFKCREKCPKPETLKGKMEK